MSSTVAEFCRFIEARRILDWALPVSIAGWVISRAILGTDLTLHHFDDRSIGMTVLAGLDVARRTALWPSMITLFGALLLLYWAVAWGVTRKLLWLEHADVDRWSAAMGTAQLLALVSLSSMLWAPAAQDRRDLQTILLNWACVATVVASADAYLRTRSHRRLPSPSMWTSWTVAAWCFAYFDCVIRKHWEIDHPRFLIDGWILTLLVVATLPILTRSIRNRSSRAWLPVATLPILMLPATGLLAQEVGYSLLSRWHATPSFHDLVMKLAAGLVLAAIATIAASLIRQSPPPALLRRAGRTHLPLLVAITSASPILRAAGSFMSIDWFHMGETLLPAHQLVRFGSLPYLDIMPTHGVFPSYLGGLVSWLLNGRIVPDGEYLGRAIMSGVASVVVYFLVRRLTASALFAVFVVLLLPAIMPMRGGVLLTADVYGIGMIGALALADAVARGAHLRFGAIVVGALALRHDIGIYYALIAVVFCCVYAALFRNDWRRVAGVAVRVAGPVAVVLLTIGAAVYWRNGSLENLELLRQFLSLGFQSMTLGYEPVFRDLNSWVGYTMFLLPSVTVAGVLVLASGLVRDGIEARRVNGRRLTLIALATYNLFVMMRVWTRHTEAESPFFAYSFTVLVVLLMIYEFCGSRQDDLRVLAIGGVVALAAPGVVPSRAETALLSTPYASVERPRAFSEVSLRYRVDEKHVHGLSELRGVVDIACGDAGTFVDVSHSPLLYPLLDRRFPGFVIPMFYVASDTMQRDLIDRIQRDDVTLSIQNHEEWWPNDVDRVSDTIRSYRVMEFIHDRFPDNYRLSRFVVASSADLRGIAGVERITQPPEFAEVGLLPRIWAQYDNVPRGPETTDLMGLFREAAGADGSAALVLMPRTSVRIACDLPPSRSSYLTVVANQSSPAGSLAVRYQKAGDDTMSGVGFTTVAGEQAYLLRPSGQGAWWGNRANLVAFEVENRSDAVVEVRRLSVDLGD